MTTFDTAFAILLGEEGGYSDDTNDSGGATKFGISQASYPNLDIANLTLPQAKQIYIDDYWNPLQCDKLNPILATVIFCEAVNMGKNAVIRLLQNTVGAVEDGILGAETVGMANQQNPLTTCDYLNARFAIRYPTLNNYAIYGKGWMTRLFTVYRKALTNGGQS